MRLPAFIFCLSLFAAAGCSQQQHEESDKNQLSTDLIHNPRTASGIDAQTAAKMPTLDFSDSTHDFGLLHDGEMVNYEFSFLNNGKSPLLISSATASCGCTVPEYPREPVAPGATGKLKVSFNSSGKSGKVEKTVTISDNTLRGNHYLKIAAEVKPKEN